MARDDPAHRRRRAPRPPSSSRQECNGVDELRRAVDPYTPADGRSARRHPRRRLRRRRRACSRPQAVAWRWRAPGRACRRRAARCSSTSSSRSTRSAVATCGRASWCGTRARSSSRCRASRRRRDRSRPTGSSRSCGCGSSATRSSARPTSAIADEILEPGRRSDPGAHQLWRQPARCRGPTSSSVREALGVGRAARAVRPVDVVDGEARGLRDRADVVARGPGHDQLRRHAARVRAGLRPAETVGAVHARPSSHRRREVT